MRSHRNLCLPITFKRKLTNWKCRWKYLLKINSCNISQTMFCVRLNKHEKLPIKSWTGYIKLALRKIHNLSNNILCLSLMFLMNKFGWLIRSVWVLVWRILEILAIWIRCSKSSTLSVHSEIYYCRHSRIPIWSNNSKTHFQNYSFLRGWIMPLKNYYKHLYRL